MLTKTKVKRRIATRRGKHILQFRIFAAFYSQMKLCNPGCTCNKSRYQYLFADNDETKTVVITEVLIFHSLRRFFFRRVRINEPCELIGDVWSHTRKKLTATPHSTAGLLRGPYSLKWTPAVIWLPKGFWVDLTRGGKGRAKRDASCISRKLVACENKPTVLQMT